QPEVALRVRIAAGEVLGYLGDPRLGQIVTVRAGKFLMGEGGNQHEIDLPDYRVGQYPVTNAEFGRFVEARGYNKREFWTDAGWQQKNKAAWTEPRWWDDGRYNQPNQPVVGVSWYECVAYCHWLNAETGRAFKLPTEAEWEKAARGGGGQQYPWGTEFEAPRLNARDGEQHVQATTPIGIYPTGVSPNKIYDAVGNVWEWCATKWGKDYPYNTKEDEWSEEYLKGTDVRVLRGGSWGYLRYYARCVYRNANFPSSRNYANSFRLVISPI
ncbi:MAG: SUMF1/EgtB/PvdO family nonheme iron enzyme, partial [Anaerolineae bacterium]|nr:SUMF1/EgtB/PvdO family nonheme iron enzyme [Anaerolineae bacterium]